MAIKREEKDGYAVIKIDGPFSVYEAADLRNEFIECFENYDGLILDLEEVSDCDTAGVQLLCSAHITSGNEGKPFTVAKASDSVITAVTCAGLNPDKILNPREEK